MIEQRSIIRNLTARKEEGTYAHVFKKSVERKRSLSRKREESHLALIYPSKEEKGIDSSSVIKENIKPVELGIGIKRFQKVRKGGVLIEVTAKEELQKIELELNSNSNLKEY